MRAEDFANYLDQCGLRYKENSKAFNLQDCPSCGSESYKVYLYKDDGRGWDRYYGKCHKCHEDFSSYRYLITMGQSRDEVKKLHNITSTSPEDFDKLDVLGESQPLRDKKLDEYAPVEHSIDHLTGIYDWKDHPASQYAIKRGVTEILKNEVMFEHKSSAVVFLCRENGKVVGYQYRYMNPTNPDMKTWNPPSFKKSNHIIEYQNSGDIVICEGPFTAVSGHHFGFHAICTFGAGISTRQLELIKIVANSTKKKVYVAFDRDSAGLSGFIKIKSALLKDGIEVKRIVPESGNDLNDSWKAGKSYIVIDSDDIDTSIPVLQFKLFKDGYSL